MNLTSDSSPSCNLPICTHVKKPDHSELRPQSGDRPKAVQQIGNTAEDNVDDGGNSRMKYIGVKAAFTVCVSFILSILLFWFLHTTAWWALFTCLVFLCVHEIRWLQYITLRVCLCVWARLWLLWQDHASHWSCEHQCELNKSICDCCAEKWGMRVIIHDWAINLEHYQHLAGAICVSTQQPTSPAFSCGLQWGQFRTIHVSWNQTNGQIKATICSLYLYITHTHTHTEEKKDYEAYIHLYQEPANLFAPLKTYNRLRNQKHIFWIVSSKFPVLFLAG